MHLEEPQCLLISADQHVNSILQQGSLVDLLTQCSTDGTELPLRDVLSIFLQVSFLHLQRDSLSCIGKTISQHHWYVVL